MCVCLCLVFVVAGSITVAASADRPNLIVLLTDDQRADHLGVAGHPRIHTPHIDRMAGQGVRFTNAYVTTSICSVSRACILTGQHAAKHGVHVLDTPLSAAQFAQTYPALLRRAGYRTGHVGKWHLGKMEGPAAELFDDWRGFEQFAVHYNTTDANGEPIHLTRKHGNEAIELLRTYAKDDRPFCLNLWFQAPHDEFWAPDHVDGAVGFRADPAFLGHYDGWTADKAVSFGEYESTVAPPLRPHLELRKRFDKRFADPAVRVRTHRNYCALITGVDDVVGRIRAELDRLGLADNTIIVFLSDNGFYHGEHGLAGKFWAHEPSVRVPMIWYDPTLADTRRGSVDESVVLNIDVTPTLLSYAGVDVPAGMQGRNLQPLLHGQRVGDWRKEYFFQHLYQAYRTDKQTGETYPTIPPCEGVVGGRYKYVRFIPAEQHREILGKPPIEEWLYDLHDDPHERRNLAPLAEHRATLEAMRRRCDELESAASK